LALAVFDDGAGAALYAGGTFTSAGGVPANRIAKWDGTSWSAVGSGVVGAIFSLQPSVNALATFDDGSGPALYAGGTFTSAGGVTADCIARWNGTSWSALGSGLSGGTQPAARSLAVFDDGSGAALFVGGGFQLAGGAPAAGIAKWNGTSWSALG